MITKIHIDLNKLQVMALLAPKADLRTYLNGVHVEADAIETRLIATDGAHLGVLRRAGVEGMDNIIDAGIHGAHVAFTIPVDIIARMKPQKYMAAAATVLIEPQPQIDTDPEGNPIYTHRYTVRLLDSTLIPFQPCGGKYPTLRRVMPTSAPTNVWTPLDVNRLALFAKVNAALGASKMDAGRLIIGFHESKAQIQFRDYPAFMGVLMEMRKVPEATAFTALPELMK
jgi:hypothetical protein